MHYEIHGGFLEDFNVRAFLFDHIEELLPISTSFWLLLNQNREEIIKCNGTLENRTILRRDVPLVVDMNPEKHLTRCCTMRAVRIGLVPLRALPGDPLYVVLGARMPFVLRKT
jgi:hypothetical protein